MDHKKILILGCHAKIFAAQQISKVAAENNLEIHFLKKIEKEITVFEPEPLTFIINKIPTFQEPFIIDTKINCVKNFGMNKISKRKY